MRQLIAGLMFLSCAVPSWATIAYVSTSGTNCSQTTASVGVACTLAGTTTANNTVVVGLSWKTTTRSIERVVGSATKTFFFPYSQGCNGSGTCSAVLICFHCQAITTVTPTFTGTTLYELNVAEYSGVASIGITGPVATATSTAPAITITTGDANDWLIVVASALATGGVPTSNTGNLRQANRTGTTSSNVAGALCDNTVASAGSLKCQVTITSVAWDAVGVELRSTVTQAHTYIFPDCDATHPCLIHEKDTPSKGTNTDTLTSPLVVSVPSNLANNLIKLVISVPDAVTLGTPTDDQSRTWVAGASTDDTSNHVLTKGFHICGAAAGPSNGQVVISIPWTGTFGTSVVSQVDYQEVAGIATSSCTDGSNAANGLQNRVQPGAYTTASNGDYIATFGAVVSSSMENSQDGGVIQADDNAAVAAVNIFDQWASDILIQTTASSTTNPSIWLTAQDVNNSGGVWMNVVSEAFQASSGAGAQPTTIAVVTDQQFYNCGTSNCANAVGWNPMPAGGNALVITTSNPSTGAGSDITNLTSNLQETFTKGSTSGTAATDPQMYYSCVGSNTVSRDRIFTFSPDTNSIHMEVYTVANARSSGVSAGSGCQGASSTTGSNTQGATTNTNIVGAPAFTPTINSGATSVIFTTSYVGTGPPKGLCVSGGVTPPSCTGQSTNTVFNSIWASGMTDASGWSTADPFTFYYTASTSSKSMDYLMASGVGGTTWNGGGLEIEGQAAAGTTTPPMWIIQ
jgi:hypothetical protein